jgi:uncharacterized protein (DUF952 family)
VNLKELVAEVKARGFEYESDARIERWLNQAYREVVDYKPWPFLTATKEGTAPLEVADFGHAAAVVDVTADLALRYAGLGELVLVDADLSSTGSPVRWYITDGSTIEVYPANTDHTIKVTYAKVAAELKEDTDVPIVPTAYQGVIVDGAVAKAYKPSDNFEAMQFVRQEFDRGLKQMVHALLRPNYDSHRRILRTGIAGDY